MIILIDVCSCCEAETDYHGHDINNKKDDENYGAKVDSALSCQKLCQARPACRFFTYAKDILGIGNCWLKTTDLGRRYHKNHISGKKYCGNHSTIVYIIRHFWKPSEYCQ